MVNNLDIKTIIAKKRNKGELNKDEYGIVLERFRKAGFKDAFLRILK